MNLKMMGMVVGLLGLIVGVGLSMLLDSVTFLLGAEEPTRADAIAAPIGGLALMVVEFGTGRWAWRHERERLGDGTDFAEELLPLKPPAERWARLAMQIYATLSALFLGVAVFLGVSVAIGGLKDGRSFRSVGCCIVHVCCLLLDGRGLRGAGHAIPQALAFGQGGTVMSHKCGPGCRRRQTPSQRSGCPSCGSRPRLPETITARGVTRTLTKHLRDDAHSGVTASRIQHVLENWVDPGHLHGQSW